ncbi:MAG: hypothetical protein E7443_03770 [Ruminococcaceae bacterium]|nr:hypothetical protein [Oscillospiraceae bacterium]
MSTWHAHAKDHALRHPTPFSSAYSRTPKDAHSESIRDAASDWTSRIPNDEVCDSFDSNSHVSDEEPPEVLHHHSEH